MMTESSTVLLWESVDVWLPKQFPQRIFNRLKVLRGPPELLHLQDLTFLRDTSLKIKEVEVGGAGAARQESWILLTALFLSSLCVTLEKWLYFSQVGHEKGLWFR